MMDFLEIYVIQIGGERNGSKKNGEFGGYDMGLGLMFCTDGVCPHKTIHNNYSMWPLMMSSLNFPPSFRKSVGGIMLLGIIPGNGRKTAYHLDPYFDLIIDELLELSHAYIYYPAYMSSPIWVKVRLLQYVLDFPGISKVMQQPGTGGIKACPWCGIAGKYCDHLSKTYTDNRRYLPNMHPLRRSNLFPGESTEVRKEPEAISYKDERQIRQAFDLLPNNNQRKNYSRAQGVKGTYTFMRLPYHRLHEHYQPDGMHTIPDILYHVFDWLNGKAKPGRIERAEKNLRSSVDDMFCYSLSKEQKQIVNNRCKGLLFPKSCSGNVGNIMDNPKETLKNTHGWEEYTSFNVWSYLLHDCLCEIQRRTLLHFFRSLLKLHSKKFEKSNVEQIVLSIDESLALLERDCPSSISNITTHILHHVARKISDYGPIYSTWMYPFERMNSYITRRANNRSRVERCIMETIQICDWILYAGMTGRFKNVEDKMVFIYG